MDIETRIFGTLTIDDDKIVNFPEGLPGFEHLHQFIVVILEQTKPFYWLQAIEEDIALPMISPFEIDPDYSPLLPEGVDRMLALENEEDLLVLAVAVIPADVTAMTANLAAPILINIDASIGMQALLEGNAYSVRTPIYKLIQHNLAAGGRSCSF